MRRNCNLELRLLPLSDPSNIHHYQDELQQQNMVEQARGSLQQEQQPITIFYNGQVCVSDVTEVQARTILMLASREMEDQLIRTPSGSEPTSPSLPLTPVATPTTTGLSIKRSLERFLQKRKHRSQAASPYSQLTRS